MGSTGDFFKKKKEWSKIKDDILDYYLKPYISKILRTYRPLIIFDCFAGKGKFDDGNNGSPIIISERIKESIDNDFNSDITGIFIEKKYHKYLRVNLKDYDFTEVLQGSFEENMKKLLYLNSRYNVFMYLDPYGIKSLDFDRFSEMKNKDFNSLEMLLNFNSIGFFREGFKLLKYEDPIEKDKSDVEYEYDSNNNIENMNKIANGEYWQDILRDCKNHKIKTYRAEELFIEKYVEQLEILFEYVVNIPIKIKTKNIPKYRMIFCTNSYDGLFLMNDFMHKKWKEILEKERRGQQVFFEFDFPGFFNHDHSNIKECAIGILKKEKKPILLKELYVQLIKKYGISFLISDYRDIIKEMRKSKIEIIYSPKRTPTGKIPTLLDYNNRRYKISLGLKNEK